MLISLRRRKQTQDKKTRKGGQVVQHSETSTSQKGKSTHDRKSWAANFALSSLGSDEVVLRLVWNARVTVTLLDCERTWMPVQPSRKLDSEQTNHPIQESPQRKRNCLGFKRA